jgi:hypothetical protein
LSVEGTSDFCNSSYVEFCWKYCTSLGSKRETSEHTDHDDQALEREAKSEWYLMTCPTSWIFS